ncbi:MAG: cytidylate kinase [Gammaproteobacteria bacterium]|nr:(d)CMP kinase [bacterium AH-315-E07]PCH60585.1 MAG: cytidylate kinase [Gammaproteobacteria bacterium]
MTAAAPIITLDGPGGAGKGTISRLLACRLGWHLLDSGAMYRVTALAATKSGVDFSDIAAVTKVASTLDVVFEPSDSGVSVILAGEDVSAEIRTEACGELASRVATIGPVREALLGRQRAFQRMPGLVADGRDMGTVVFPAAELKIYLTASAEERARRRYKQLIGKGISVNLARLLEDIVERDQRDMTRELAPLKPAEDAVVVDTTALTIDEVVTKISNLWDKVR